jgi:cellulose synthase/poly-beta-1,6-N-acetylglucosamine synthase-like glycosyltransferase
MIPLLAGSLAALAYVYVGYPLLLRLLVWLRGPRAVQRADITPPMSLVISAYNEAAVIRAKLENALSLDYPSERLEIVVVSDASTDGTDAIVAEYANRGVRLVRQTERRGKTAGLNRAMPLLIGDIVVFSDANALYERDALRKLARNFADPEVGCVTGEARYVPGQGAAADVGERAYWSYETRVKRLETALGSMVGGDGAIYAIRRALWRDLPENVINDFFNPLQIVAAGWRGVYEPEAVCYEETAGMMGAEYRRRVRIVSRSWRAVFQAREVLNPWRVGLFAWCVVSHKLLRWVTGIFAAMAVGAALGLFVQIASRWPTPSLVVVALAAFVVAGTIRGRQAVGMAVYYAVINSASLVGVLRGSLGRVSGVWVTPRERPAGRRRQHEALVPIGRVVQLLIVVTTAGTLAACRVMPIQQFAPLLFWTSTAALVFVYIWYPAILAFIRPFIRRPVEPADIEPGVCVYIAANDEAAVIRQKLVNTLALDYPSHRLDIVVASDGSVDGTNAIVRAFAPRVRLLEFAQRRGKIAAINAGMSSVTAEIVVFSDANTFLEPNAIRAVVRNFADGRVGAVSGDVRLEGDRAALGRSEDLYYRFERWVQAAESDIGSIVGVDGALYGIRRDLFTAPPNDTILDDMAIPMGVIRAGRRVVFEPAARAHEHGSESAMEEFSRKTRVIAGAVQFLTRHDSALPLRAPQVIFSMVAHKVLRWLSPAFAICTIVASISLAGTSATYAAAAVGQGLLILLGVAGCIPALRRASVIGFAHYFCLVQAAAGVGLLRGLRGSQPVTWRRFSRVPAELA